MARLSSPLLSSLLSRMKLTPRYGTEPLSQEDKVILRLLKPENIYFSTSEYKIKCETLPPPKVVKIHYQFLRDIANKKDLGCSTNYIETGCEVRGDTLVFNADNCYLRYGLVKEEGAHLVIGILREFREK